MGTCSQACIAMRYLNKQDLLCLLPFLIQISQTHHTYTPVIKVELQVISTLDSPCYCSHVKHERVLSSLQQAQTKISLLSHTVLPETYMVYLFLVLPGRAMFSYKTGKYP